MTAPGPDAILWVDTARFDNELTQAIVTDKIPRGNDALGEILMDTNLPAPNTPEPKTCSVKPVCPVCGGSLFEIRSKLQCSRCHTICETCCEGGRG